MVLPVVLRDGGAVEQLAKQVAVPPNAEVHGEPTPPHHQIICVLRVVWIFGCIHNLSFHIAYAVAVGTPHLAAGIGGVDIGSHAAPHVSTALDLEYNLTCAGVP